MRIKKRKIIIDLECHGGPMTYDEMTIIKKQSPLYEVGMAKLELKLQKYMSAQKFREPIYFDKPVNSVTPYERQQAKQHYYQYSYGAKHE